MPIGWDELSMPAKGCSVCVPIAIINFLLLLIFKVRGVNQDSVPYVVKAVLWLDES